MAHVIPNAYKAAAGAGSISWTSDTIKVALCTTFTPNPDTQTYWSDVSANEVSGTNYTAGGATLGSKTATADNTNDRGVYDAADASWANLTVSNVTHAVVYKSTGVSSTSPIIAILDLGGAQSQTAGTFTLQWDTAGVFYLG